jgi:S-adenosylmethionine:tRNA ribosyltransferase-isomerase
VKTVDFSFDLPEELIAQFPPERRGDSRLLVLDSASGRITHTMCSELARYIEPGTLMIFNDTRVRKARVHGEAVDTGARVEFLLLARQDDGTWEASCTKMRKQGPGRRYRFEGGVEGEIVPMPGGSQAGDVRHIRFSPDIDEAWLEVHGHIPLPPYIKRGDEASDAERYQTVFARATGSSAAPTAGLHFTEPLLDELRNKGIEMANVTLHVGLGTFLPVRCEDIEDHPMHEEAWSIPTRTATAVNRAKAEGRPLLAIGTTSVRTLESAWQPAHGTDPGGLRPGEGRTRIFIHPGYEWKVVDRLFTNFHTPKSTLLMLVSAFAGRETVLQAYADAVAQRYRFFSYGDAMLIR